MRHFAAMLLTLSACTFSWDKFDPRLDRAPSSSSSSASGGGSGGSGASASGGAGHGATGGYGGAGGAGGGAAACGDSTIDVGEECDDGNLTVDDGCDADCLVECKGGAKHPQTYHCYVVVEQALDWQPARDACLAIDSGFDLVAISSQAEFDWFVAEPSVVAALATDNIWLGGNDMQTEGTFVWTNGEPFFDDGWAPNQPDDGSTGEDCVHLRRTDSQFNDYPCSNNDYYACERAPAGS